MPDSEDVLPRALCECPLKRCCLAADLSSTSKPACFHFLNETDTHTHTHTHNIHTYIHTYTHSFSPEAPAGKLPANDMALVYCAPELVSAAMARKASHGGQDSHPPMSPTQQSDTFAFAKVCLCLSS